MIRQTLWFAAIVGLAGLGCAPSLKVANANQALSPYEDASEVAFSFELDDKCSLQRAADGEHPPKNGWTDFETKDLANKFYKVTAHELAYSRSGEQELVAPALRVVTEDKSFWIRGTPAANVETAAANFACAVPRSAVDKAMPKLDAPVVRLSPLSSTCQFIDPIFGDGDSVVFEPYTVTARNLFNNHGQPVVGIRIEADGGEKALTVPAATFDRCFVAADRVPPAPAEALALTGWLTATDTESVAPPIVSLDTVEQLTGLDVERCIGEGSRALRHYECRSPVLRIQATTAKGPYGPPLIRFSRERVVDAIHLYAGKLVPPNDIVSANVSLRLDKVSASSFSRAFSTELDRSLVSPDLQLKRASNGFRLLRNLDVSAGVPVTHQVQIDIDYSIPEVVATLEHRSRDYVAGKREVDNPEFHKAEQGLEEAKSALENAKKAAEVAAKGTEVASAVAGKACGKVASQFIPFGGILGNAACSEATSAAGGAAEQEILSRATAGLTAAQQKLQSTPHVTSVDDVRQFPYDVTIYRRSGDATAKIAVNVTGQSVPQATTSVTFHFEAKDDEYAASPEHGLAGKTARVPTASDVEHELASNLIERIDAAIIRWASQRQIGGDIGELQPGTRSWMVSVARHAAGDRNVKLLSDILERRSEALLDNDTRYPVTMPNETNGKCFTFAAIPLDTEADINLAFGRVNGNDFTPFITDQRSTAEASFEVCDPQPGSYMLQLSHGKQGSNKGVLVSMFETTPGAATAADTVAASKGLPTTVRKGETLALNGNGVVEYRGTNNRVVTGRTGDRDGDGIPDDEDRCPYDPETVNNYLDEDGCPDVAPSTPPSAKPAPRTPR